jgi:GAF domain-containing protein
LKLLVDPMAIQDRPALVERNFLRAGVSSMVGRYSLCDFERVGPTLRMGGPVVVADARTSPLLPDPDRAAVAAVAVSALVAAPLVRDGRLVAALCVTDLSPRAWTP